VPPEYYGPCVPCATKQGNLLCNKGCVPIKRLQVPLEPHVPIDGKLEQICFQFWVALSFGEPCAIFGSFQTLSRMFSHGRAVSAGAVKEIIGWAAGSVPLAVATA
jgi:hypothetical protein